MNPILSKTYTRFVYFYEKFRLEAFSANHLVLGAAGSRRTGGTTRGAVLALAGSIVGGLMGIGLPVPLMGPLLGVCLGVFAGALLGNLWAGRKLFQSLAAGCGAAIGHFWGTILKLAIGAIIAVMLAIAAFV
jgi:uncharacterized protein